MNKNYRKEHISFIRKVVIASLAATKKQYVFHLFSEVDFSLPRQYLAEYKRKYGESLSFTGYITKCFAVAVAKHPELNCFKNRNNLIFPDELKIRILIERTFDGELVPRPLILGRCGEKNLKEIHAEIRKAQQLDGSEDTLRKPPKGLLSRLIPIVSIKSYIRSESRRVKIGLKYGTLAVTSVGMHTGHPLWVIPDGNVTVLLSVGSIVERPVFENGVWEPREHLCLTATFDHDIVDGAPAARFMDDLIGEIKSGSQISGMI